MPFKLVFSSDSKHSEENDNDDYYEMMTAVSKSITMVP